MSISGCRFLVCLPIPYGIHVLTCPCRFPSKEGPQYRKGGIVNVTFQCLGLLLTLAMTVWYRYENKRRDKVEGGKPVKGEVIDTLNQFDLAPGFRYVV